MIHKPATIENSIRGAAREPPPPIAPRMLTDHQLDLDPSVSDFATSDK